MQRHDLATTRTACGDNVQLTIEAAFASDTAPKFIGLRDFGDERAVLFHVGKGKTTQIQEVLHCGERSLTLTHRQTLAADIKANCGNTVLMHYIPWQLSGR